MIRQLAGAVVLLLSVAPGSSAQRPSKADLTRWRATARNVTIYRDRFGIPHVHGRTDAETMFGMAYARAQDRFPETEMFYLQGLGRTAEVLGEDGVGWDVFVRAFELERRGREEYAQAGPALQALVDGWADGTNYYLHRHPEVRSKLPLRYEGWMAFMMYRGFAVSPDQADVDVRSLAKIVEPAPKSPNEGSNMWAVSAAKSASGYPMLFANPHTPMLPVYESHWMSDEGWNVTGLTAYAQTLLPVMGHNARLGWAHTVNSSDVVDIWEETFDDPSRPLAYRYGSGYRVATEWRDSLRVKTAAGLVMRYLTLRKTHHGPILGARDGKQLAVNYGNVDKGGLLQQWYAMGKARNFAEFKAAVAINGLTYHNIMYADQAGNIYFLHAGVVPKRDTAFDWSKPVNGSDPRTDWQGYHRPDEMPSVTNPRSGWMQNTNSTPFLTSTDDVNPKRASFPKYVGLHPDNWRARASRALLAGPERFTFDRFNDMAFDTRFYAANREVPLLLHEWHLLRAVDSGRAAGVAELVLGMEGWDRIGRVDSKPALWFAAYQSVAGPASLRGDTTTWFRIKALEEVRTVLTRDFGSTAVTLGDFQRLQRPNERAEESYRDDRPSLPLPSVEGTAVGAIFSVWSQQPKGQKRRYAVGGSAYVAVMEFGPTVRASTITPFGQSADPASPHFFDQAPIFASGRLRPSWFTMEDIRANLERAYRPGEESSR